MANDLWRTPPEVFNFFNAKYNFQCDVAASDQNHLCDKYYTESNSALDCYWAESVDVGTFAWCNPPYSNPLPWVKKCIAESSNYGIGSVLLLNNDMSTKWAKLLTEIACKIIVITGKRVAFLNSDGVAVKGNNKGQVIFVIPPFVRMGDPLTEYQNLADLMVFSGFKLEKLRGAA